MSPFGEFESILVSNLTKKKKQPWQQLSAIFLMSNYAPIQQFMWFILKATYEISEPGVPYS